MSFKDSIISTLAEVGSRKIKSLPPKHVTIVIYHRILPAQDGFKYDDGVVSTTPEIFDEEVRFFKEYFTPITFAQLKRTLTKKEPLPMAPLIITFDDGYVDNYTHAFPVLRKHGVPATIFLSVHNIEAQKPYWWDEVVYCMKALKKSPVETQAFLRKLKLEPNSARLIELQEFFHQYKVNRADMERLTMTWTEIKEMSIRGIEFGGHTMTHPMLSQVEDIKDIEYEIGQSKRTIEERLNEEVVVFSYPFGGANAYNHLVQTKVKEAGYSFAVTYVQGVNDFKNPSLDHFALKRMDMDKESLIRVKAKVSWPGSFSR